MQWELMFGSWENGSSCSCGRGHIFFCTVDVEKTMEVPFSITEMKAELHIPGEVAFRALAHTFLLLRVSLETPGTED